MNKKIKIKRITVLFMVLIFTLNSFAAIVSDNDGAAFITKAEFDSLKNNFQTQIDSYNNSIDSKIDGAIAAYLSGISVTKTQILTNIYENSGGKDIKWVNFSSLPTVEPSWNNCAIGIVSVACWTQYGALTGVKGPVAEGTTTNQYTTIAWMQRSSGYPMGANQLSYNTNFDYTKGYTRIELDGEKNNTKKIKSFNWISTAAMTSVYCYELTDITTISRTNSRYGTSPWGNLTFENPSNSTLLSMEDTVNTNNKNSSATMMDTQYCLKLDLTKVVAADKIGTKSVNCTYSANLNYYMQSNLSHPGVASGNWEHVTGPAGRVSTFYTTSNVSTTATLPYVNGDSGLRKFPVQIYKNYNLSDLYNLHINDKLYSGARLCQTNGNSKLVFCINAGTEKQADKFSSITGLKMRIAFNDKAFEDDADQKITGNINITKIGNIQTNSNYIEFNSGDTEKEITLDVQTKTLVYVKAQLLNNDSSIYTGYEYAGWIDIGEITATED